MAVSVTGNVRNGLTKIVLPALRRSGCYECHTPMQWVPGALSPGIKRPGREADQSPPSSAEVKNEWCYTSTPNMSS
jgi:hypothetical protein